MTTVLAPFIAGLAGLLGAVVGFASNLLMSRQSRAHDLERDAIEYYRRQITPTQLKQEAPIRRVRCPLPPLRQSVQLPTLMMSQCRQAVMR